ncbi:MAG: hypothetical protein ACYC3F_09255 [Gemmatimonadaceae bacterium]
MLGRAPLYLAAVLSLTLAATAAAQRSESARLVHLRAPASGSVSVVPERTGSAPLLPAESGAKSPLAAGVLSLFMPGVGSFYAGNSKHGFVHFGIALGSMFVVMASCGQGNDAPCGGVADAAVLVNLVNWPWSIVTAVRDARATKDGASRRSQR